MKAEQLEKGYLRERIIPLLFSTKNAKIFRSARTTLKSYDTSIEDLQNKYRGVDKKDKDFWLELSELVAQSYDKEQPTFSKENFRKFIKELLTIRFEKGFRKNDVRKLEDSTDIDGFLEEIEGGNNLILQDEEGPKLIYAGKRATREYTEPLMPRDEEFYPPILIEIDKDNYQLLLSGDKSQRNRFVHRTTEIDEIKLQDEEPEAYEELEIDPGFISQLKSHDIFLKKISISGSDSISLKVSSGEENAIEIQDFVDYDLLLQDKQDILELNKCEFIYVTEDEDVEFKLNFQTFKRTEGSEEFLKIALEIPDEYNEYREDIEGILKDHGIEVYEPYYKPASYYFNKLLTTNANYRSQYLEPLKEMSENDDLEILVDNNIIEVGDDSVNLDKDKLIQKVKKILKQAEKKDIELKGREYRIARIEEIKDNKVDLVLKSYSDDVEDEHRRFYRISIPFRARPDKFDKIFNVILSRINFHQIMTADESEEIVEYIVKAAKRQIKYHQELIVKKEARRSLKILESYQKEPQEYRERFKQASVAGYEIQDHINVLLRHIFGNYIAAGGANVADGALTINGKSFLVDSKQSDKISQSPDLTKGKQDLEESELVDMVDTDSLIFVVSKDLLKTNTESGSLNPDARDRVSRGSDVEFLFLSVDAIIQIYEIFSEYSTILGSNQKAREKAFDRIKELIDKSKYQEDVEELAEIEEECLGKLRSDIDDESKNYYPEKKLRHF